MSRGSLIMELLQKSLWKIQLGVVKTPVAQVRKEIPRMREEVLIRYWTERPGRFDFKWNTDERRGTSRGDNPKLTSTTFALAGYSAHSHAVVYCSVQNRSVSDVYSPNACGFINKALFIKIKALRFVKHCNGLSYHAIQTVLHTENSPVLASSLSTGTRALVQLGTAGHIPQILGFSTSRIGHSETGWTGIAIAHQDMLACCRIRACPITIAALLHMA
ncbi:unnamed protein product, partial [Coregonus sp. 'balchen']